MKMRWLSGQKSIIPGFGLSFGYTVTYLCILVLLPLSAVVAKASGMSLGDFWTTVTAPRVLAAYKLTFSTSLAAAVVNAVFGFLVAWVLVRYKFFGDRIVDALVDLPFALPTAVAGIALTAVYGPNGWLGSSLAKIGLKVAFTPLGITIALIFIGLPFVVRTVQPVLQDLGKDMEEAAGSLGASRWHIFRYVILPQLVPAILTGFALAFARGLGEYGSVVFISGNMPMKTEIVPLVIITKLEQFDYQGATSIAVVMLVASFVLLLLINLLQRWTNRYLTATGW